MGLMQDMKQIKEALSEDGFKDFMKKFVEMLNQINANILITQENQIEIGRRLERIENKLGLKPYTDQPQIGKLQ